MDTKDDQPSLEEKEEYKSRLMTHWDHCENVRQSAKKLAIRLIDDEGELDLARRLLQRANCHDTSKFSGIQFWLSDKNATPDQIKMAVTEHHANNDHHPEFFAEGIKSMCMEQIAELVVDWHARSKEQGTDLRQWIKDEATKKYNFSLQSNAYKKIKKFVDLLLDPPFKKI